MKALRDALAGPGFHEFRLREGYVAWCGTDYGPRFDRMIPHARHVSAIPRWSRDVGDVNHDGHVIWTRLNTRKAEHALSAFTPPPTLVLRRGRTLDRIALWALREPLSTMWIWKANRRLAHHFGAVKKGGQPGILLPCWPAEHHTPGRYPVKAVVGGLYEPPEPQFRP